ncbi:DNA polymerase subunit gamma-2, mitochondrial [Uranotaenia lowii]|uniref:DNA polymerase subunit gamma-2, mitochondrial n=1 Tax=Uranotaenia lowii TaxID=190385 RepID=UPI00247A8491|nr:DNA polymerase subunit gamma-2, mitochondrial [Uranotaenia lowii]
MSKLLRTGSGPVPFRQLLETCRNSKFLGLNLMGDVIGNFLPSPIGRMLRNNIREEFVQGGSGTPIYEGSSSLTFEKNLNFAKETFNTTVPFGITLEESFFNKEIFLNEVIQLQLDKRSQLSCTYLVNPGVQNEFMYKTQRQRKIWWMRFACDPGRYFISDTRTEPESKVQSVWIKARYGDAEIELEQLEMIPSGAAREIVGDFQVKVGRSTKKITPSLVRVKQCLELATLQVVLDALDVSDKDCIRIHRKLAPYKCGIICSTDDPVQLNELQDLAKHLGNVLRKSSLTVLDCSNQNGSSDRSAAKRFSHLDSIGVPYCLILREQSLQNGLLQLRSRDTTLSETIHISDLPNYLLKIITN